MSVASQLLNPPTYRYPHIRSGVEWSSYGLDNLTIEKFYDFRFAKADSILSVYWEIPGDTDQKVISQYIKGIHDFIIYEPTAGEEIFSEEYSKLIGKTRMFVSSDGAYLMEQHAKTRVESDVDVCHFGTQH